MKPDSLYHITTRTITAYYKYCMNSLIKISIIKSKTNKTKLSVFSLKIHTIMNFMHIFVVIEMIRFELLY